MLRENAAIARQNRHDEVRASCKRCLGSNNLLFYSIPLSLLSPAFSMCDLS